MNFIFLIPPSEGKVPWWKLWEEIRSFVFEKPYEIALVATHKDLKCSGKRWEESKKLNQKNCDKYYSDKKECLPAIERYSGVMYTALWYTHMSRDAQIYFQDSFLICSGMYGFLKANDTIANYKLPIETKGLVLFWREQLTHLLNTFQADIIVDFLPESYKKMIHWKDITIPVLHIDFFTQKNETLKKMTHGVKKVKGQYIRNICERAVNDIVWFPGKMRKIWEKNYQIEVIEKGLL